jgi:hypothetical protein
MGDSNIDPNALVTEKGWNKQMLEHNGKSGIDSVYQDPKTGKIYIVESKASGVKEGCKAGSLCTVNDGSKQMSRDWIKDRLDAAGVSEAEKLKVINGLAKKDGSVVRLYSGTNAKGETRFFEIKDKNGSSTDVVVDRANNEYQF